MQMRAERPRRFAFAFFGLRFTLSLRAGCCVDRLRPPEFEEVTRSRLLEGYETTYVCRPETLHNPISMRIAGGSPLFPVQQPTYGSA